MMKVANKSYKSINHHKTKDENADFLLLLFTRNHYNSKIRKLINHETMEDAEESKEKVVKDYIKNSRNVERWFYLASSHNDCAKDLLYFSSFSSSRIIASAPFPKKAFKLSLYTS